MAYGDNTEELSEYPVGVLGKAMTPELLKKKKPTKPSPVPESPLAAKAKEIGGLGMPEARFANVPAPGTMPGNSATALGMASQAGKKLGLKKNA